MQYDLTINQHNIKPHLDIERDLKEKKEGLFTFNLMVSQGNIENYAQFRTVTIGEYRSFKTASVKSPLSSDSGKGSQENAVRPGVR